MTKEEVKNIEHMRTELNGYCWSIDMFECNKCIFNKYCRTHAEFEDKDIEFLYECMKKKIEEDKKNEKDTSIFN